MGERNVFKDFFDLVLKTPFEDNYPACCKDLEEFFNQNHHELIRSRTRTTIALYVYDPEAIDRIQDGLLKLGSYFSDTKYMLKAEYDAFFNFAFSDSMHAWHSKNILSYTTDEKEKLINRYSEIQKQQEILSGTFQKLEYEEKKIRKKIRQNNVQSVTILGVFSAVVFTFSGGFSLVGSAFSGLNKISYCNAFLLFALIMLLSLTLIDVVYLLLSYIEIINNGIIQDENADKRIPAQLWAAIKRQPIIILINVVLIIGIWISMSQFLHISAISNQLDSNNIPVSSSEIVTLAPSIQTTMSPQLRDDNTVIPSVSVMETKEKTIEPKNTPAVRATEVINTPNPP